MVFCPMSLKVPDFGVRNGTGYCWDVTGISTDGHESPSSESRFGYRLESLGGRSPGVQIAETENDRNPAPLLGDSYGKPVQFEWRAVPGVLGYMVRVGTYPWENAVPNTDLDPAKETFPPTFTTDNFLQVDDGSQVSQGRYCWTVWPVIEDPAHPGQIWSRQPRVDKYPPFCYTSGPSFPNIKFAKSTVKAGEQIDGTIEWDYVPDGQLTISSIASPATLITSLAKCRSRGPYYADKYNCVIRFAAIAQKGMFFPITAKGYNSPEIVVPYRSPPFDDLPRFGGHEVHYDRAMRRPRQRVLPCRVRSL